MYAIERHPYGYKLIFGGFIQDAEMAQWLKEAERHLATQIGPFGVLVDMRDLKPLPSSAQDTMQAGQKQFKGRGMQRSAVILKDAIVTLQFQRIAKQTGIYAWERYIDASKTPFWEPKAVAWLTLGTDPDK